MSSDRPPPPDHEQPSRLARLRSLFAGVTYRPGWRFEVFEHPHEGPHLRIRTDVEDAFHPGHDGGAAHRVAAAAEPADRGRRGRVGPVAAGAHRQPRGAGVAAPRRRAGEQPARGRSEDVSRILSEPRESHEKCRNGVAGMGDSGQCENRLLCGASPA